MSNLIGAVFAGLFCLVIFPSIDCKVHNHFSDGEIKEIFGTDRDSVPDYDLVEIWHTINKRDASDSELILKSYGKEIKLYLQPNEGYLFGAKTPVWLSHKEDNGEIVYKKLPEYILSNATTFFHDPDHKASIVALEDEDGFSFLGNVENRIIRSLPDRFTKGILRNRRDLLSNIEKQVPKSADPSKNYTLAAQHLVYQTPETADNRKLVVDGYGFAEESIQAARSKRDIPKVVYPEILVVTDYDINFSSAEDPRLLKFLVYQLAFWNAVDLKYRDLKEPEVRLQIVGIILATNRGAVPWLKLNDGKIDAAETTLDYDSYSKLSTQEPLIPRNSFDIIVTLTNQPLCLPSSPWTPEICDNPIAGTASYNVFHVCSINNPKSVTPILVQDVGHFAGLKATVHQIGHALGADHDGDISGVKCSSNDGYIMSENDNYHLNNLVWSKCSREAISRVTSTTLECVWNEKRVQDQGPALKPILPGEITSLNEVCRARGFDFACKGHEDNCRTLLCYKSGFFAGLLNNWSCTATERAPEGSVCDFRKICLNGECVAVENDSEDVTTTQQ